MTNVGQTAVFAFTAFNAIRVFSYIPQMLKIWKDRHGSEAVSITTWTLFGLSHLSTVMYAVVVAGDYYMAAVFTANAICCGFIVGLTRLSRSRFASSTKSKPVLPRATVKPTGKTIEAPPVAGEMGWLLAVVAAFLLVHIVAGKMLTPAFADRTSGAGLDAISSWSD